MESLWAVLQSGERGEPAIWVTMPTSFCSLCSCLLHTHAKVSSTRFLWRLSPHSLLPELPKLQIFLQGLRLLQLILSRGTFSFFKKSAPFSLMARFPWPRFAEIAEAPGDCCRSVVPASRQELKSGTEALGLLTAAASPAFGSGSATHVIHYVT